MNLDSLPPEKQKSCIAEIEENISTLKSYLEHNIQKKENEPSIPATGMAVLRQQYVLVEAIQAWIASLKRINNKSLCGKTSNLEWRWSFIYEL